MANTSDKVLRDLTEEMEEEIEQEHERDLAHFKEYTLDQINSYLEESLLKTDLIVDALNSLPIQTTELGAIFLNAINDNRTAIEVCLSWLEANGSSVMEVKSENTNDNFHINHGEDL